MTFTYTGDNGGTEDAVKQSNESIRESNKILLEFMKFAEKSSNENQKFIYINTFIAIMILILTTINIYIAYNY